MFSHLNCGDIPWSLSLQLGQKYMVGTSNKSLPEMTIDISCFVFPRIMYWPWQTYGWKWWKWCGTLGQLAVTSRLISIHNRDKWYSLIESYCQARISKPWFINWGGIPRIVMSWYFFIVPSQWHSRLGFIHQGWHQHIQTGRSQASRWMHMEKKTMHWTDQLGHGFHGKVLNYQGVANL